MKKSKTRKKWFNKAPVFYRGKLLCFVGSTRPKLDIDIWLINHPFYFKSEVLIDNEGRVEKFMKKYGLN